MQPRCETCRFFSGTDVEFVYVCKRNPPVSTGDIIDGFLIGTWLSVEAEDWCGEWRETRKAGGLRLYEQIRATYGEGDA